MVAKQALTERYGITGADQQVRLSWVQITDEDLERIRSPRGFSAGRGAGLRAPSPGRGQARSS